MMASLAPRDERSGNPPLARSGYTLALVVVFLAALGLRGGVAIASIDRLEADPDAYRAIAQTLVRHGVFGLTNADDAANAIAFRPPLYPYVLAWTSTSPIGVAVLHTILGALAVVMTWAATMAVFESWRAATLAAALVAVDPILLQQSTLVMTETLACAIVAAVLWRWSVAIRDGFTIGEAARVGMLLSAAYLCRPTFLVWAVMLILGMIVMIRRGQLATWGAPMVTLTILAIAVAAWTVRNVRELGHPVWATTHGGYTLLLANNPMVYNHLRQSPHGVVWDATPFLAAYAHRYDDDPTTPAFWQRDWQNAPPPTFPDDANEVGDDQRTSAAAKATIARHPNMFMWSCLMRVSRLWSPFPLVTSERSRAATIGIGTYYIAFYAMLFFGTIRIIRAGSTGSRWVWWPAATMLLTLTLVHSVYWSNVRMRAPAIPGFAMVAAACGYRPRGNHADLPAKEFGDDVANS